MDQGRHRSRALHRVRQPDVERELGALAHRAHEHEQRHDDERDGVGVALVDEDLDRLADVQGRLAGGTRVDEDRHDPEREADVADAIDDERLLGGQRGGSLAVPEADEQVARQADQLPRHEDDEPVVGHDQEEHREHEQVQVGEEPPVAGVVAHVPDRVDVHEQADRRHDDEQAGRQRVDVHRRFDVELAGRDPREQVDLVAVDVLGARDDRRAAAQDADDEAHRDDPDHEDREDRDPMSLLAEPPPDQGRDQEPRHRQDRGGVEPVDVRARLIGASRRIRRREACACSGRWR